jgi:opacity protein-like surface antigen
MYAAKLNIGVGYAINIPNAPISLMPHAGLGYSWIFSAKTKFNGKTINHFDKDDMGGDDYKWDNMPIGWYAGLKANICKKVVIGATYGMDFTKITKGARIRTITISVGYCI